MKKRFLVLCLAMVMVCTGCGISTTKENESQKVKVVTTIFPPYDFARQIGGDKVELTMLLKPGAESHTYEPTPQDILKIKNCDVFIYGGGESDEWVRNILDSIDTSKMKVISMMEQVQAVEEETVEGMQEEAESPAHEQEKASTVEYDEHVWTSPLNAIKISAKIAESLGQKDTKNQSYYQKNYAEYKKTLTKLDQQFRDVVSKKKRNNIVVGDRFPLRYFVNEYGIKYSAAFPGCASEAEPSAATMLYLIQKVKKENIPIVFYIELSNQKLADTICEATGAEKRLIHSCHNVSAKDFENGATYVSLMESNAKNLKEALCLQ